MEKILIFYSVLMIWGGNLVNSQIRFPPEWEPHKRTFMVWPASDEVWGDLLPSVREDVARIARKVANFEPVVMLVDPGQESSAQYTIGENSNISLISLHVDDLWARDTISVFIKSGEKTRGVDYNFNGWGNKQIHENDATVTKSLLKYYGIPYSNGNLVAEGGAFETDGQGTLLVTESSIVNDNRNKGLTKSEIEDQLKRNMGITKVIWIPGVKNEDITDAHVDCLARFVSPGKVLLNRPYKGSNDPDDVWTKVSDEAKQILTTSKDAKGNPLEIYELCEADPSKISYTGNKNTFLASYVNYLVTNGGVVIPQFGDLEADAEALKTVQSLYPTREVVAVQIDTLASGGGGIHCSTHDEPI